MADVIIFNIDQKQENTIKSKRKLSSPFESFTDQYISEGVKEIVLKWIDSIKFKDKIIRREPRVVSALMFEKYNKLLVFSESESEIQYFCVKIEEKYNVYLKELNLYQQLYNKFLSSNSNKIKVIALNIKEQFNEENVLNISDTEDELSFILRTNEEHTISITFTLGEDKYLTMDKRSVISIPDNVLEEERLKIYEELFELYA
ncbi:hypothetical protein [Bacillus weihaiensis]|uniref:Uncharacterized protein n=1 Tax=Bacillus weihaiensis TaxID=1547283 RepID=A0A1L3MW18_9BACI|nr:hypothetical protein [Bacillus weihaiensis]APH06535.1 hypothetical protein A9C19_18390 [Bacillus weihaiensis]